MRVYVSSLTEEQRTASGAAGVAGTDREGFDAVVLNTVPRLHPVRQRLSLMPFAAVLPYERQR